MGVLADIFSASDAVKRRMRNLRQDPIGYLDLVSRRMKDKLLTPEGATQTALDSLGGPGVGGALGIIKGKGGNWLTGSVEDALSGLKKWMPEGFEERAPFSPHPTRQDIMLDKWGDIVDKRGLQRVLGDQALNRWVEGPLTRYVKRDMATPEDPIRALAEQGILHYQPVPLGGYQTASVDLNRTRAGYPATGVGMSPLARDWEKLSDRAINMDTAEAILNNDFPSGHPDALRNNPWLSKLDPITPVYDTGPMPVSNLGFSHLTDELANALNPESGLPRNLLITPEQVQQMGIEKAVRHVDAINKWRAEQQITANLARSQNPAVHTFKEYTENNPKGLKWVEIKQPQMSPEQRQAAIDKFIAERTSVGTWTPEEIAAVKEDPFTTWSESEVFGNALQDALRYEGDTMQHCVGRYCNDVLSGDTGIYSLRDAKGEPHVTIETDPGLIDMGDYSGNWIKGRMNQADAIKAIQELEKNPDWIRHMEDTGTAGMSLAHWIEDIKHSGLGIPSIRQIKGKQNQAPKAEYLPFVQDFVKSGRWNDVTDIQNAGLYPRHMLKPEEQALVQGDYLTMDEIKQLREGKPWTPLDDRADW